MSEHHRGPWPSEVWEQHLLEHPDADPDVPVALPEWWLLMAAKDQPLGDAEHAAFQQAHRWITGYRGSEGVSVAALAFARAATRDALYVAPQPVSRSWTRLSLVVLAGIADWCVRSGQDLSREVVLSLESRKRYLFSGGIGVSVRTLPTYQSRLNVLAAALLLDAEQQRSSIKGLASEMVAPITAPQEADLWSWSAGLRPLTRRERVQGVIALSLAVGARRKDMLDLRGKDITRDGDGVHVVMRTGGRTRTVTCRREWEELLWALAQPIGPSALVVAPSSEGTITGNGLDRSLNIVNADPSIPVPVGVTSLRTTWLVHHLTIGTPLNVLLPAADLRNVESLEKAFQFVPPADPIAAPVHLRGKG